MSATVHPLKGNQARAVAPERTVWLGASAGTGKTQVLSARVLRLLLQPGVEPDALLCLTFTKAGAAEMATRVNEVLASWVRLDATRLAAQLMAIGAPIDPATQARARSRFAAVLDGGLRIETIHAFAQWLLSAFPMEAGLLPGTRAMEDRDRDLLLRQVLADVLVGAEAAGDPRPGDALATLSLRWDQSQIERFLLRCAAAHELWEGPGGWQLPLRGRINRLLGLLAEEDGSGLAAMCADHAFDCLSLRRCMEANVAWGTATGEKAANQIGDWLAADDAGRLAALDALMAVFLTAKGEPRKAAGLEKIEPAYPDYAARVVERIAQIRERVALFDLAETLEPALTLGRAFALAWDEAKGREGLVDFDDLIRQAAGLLNRSDMADWVRYKLDRRFDHILVDEAQDTNEAQWQIVFALIEEFFSGVGQKGGDDLDAALRTLFVVGDYKQAIFRFQGTSPENFERARQRVEQALAERRDHDGGLLDLGLGQSFRTAAPILDFVDRAIERIGYGQLGLARPPEPHVGEDRPGLVTLWNVIGAPREDGEAADDGDEGEEGWLSRADRQLADRIARQVRGWIDDGFPLLKGRHRRAGPGDVMVLVRKRKELAGLIVARLHAHGVAVAGVDRLRLGAPLGVRDLMAALRFAAQPFDSLNLASLLVSPLIGWSQDELLARAFRERHLSLWAHLRASEDEATRPAMDALRALLARADFEPPQATLHWLLVGPWDGRRKLVARLGQEANDPIDELVNAAFAFQAAHTPSLHGFVTWFDSGEGELKREAGRAGEQVRVMTVHGAKGLQAPIVILADAADGQDPKPTLDLADGDRRVPLPGLRKEERVGPVALAHEIAVEEERKEHWRLLYVAMTRAEEALFLAGAWPRRGKDIPETSWYAQLAPLFDGQDALDDPLWGMRREIGSLAPMPQPVPLAAEVPTGEALPEILTRPPAPEPTPPRPLAPSALGEDLAPEPPSPPGAALGDAALRGVVMHRLLERLPAVPPGRRVELAHKWLAGQGVADGGAIVAQVLEVLDNPQWSAAFGPGSLAEVPFSAVIEGQVVSGTIDRLLVAEDHLLVMDFKTGRRPPERLEDVPVAYLRQMAAYQRALGAIYPGRAVRAALLYTHAPRLFELPDDLLAAQKLASPRREQSFSG